MLRSCLFNVLFLVCLVCGDPARAHMLNMTRINMDAGAEELAISIEIDLGQSLMSPKAYWRATQAAPENQRAHLEDVLDRLSLELVVLVDGDPSAMEFVDAEISATSLEAIENPLTPQMATLHFALPVIRPDAVQIQIGPELEVPWPCLLKVTTPYSELPQSRLLTEADRLSRPAYLSAEAVTSRRATDSLWLIDSWGRLAPSVAWIAVGFQHIIPKGLDHILFMLGLFFFNRGWRSLLLQVTGFTLAHSVTLALSTYGVVEVSPSIIEPLIALSIVYVALDNLFASQLVRWRMSVIVLFGLLHGLGFASALSDIGLPEGHFLSFLLLFNLGVELGQITVLLLAFSLTGWFLRQPWYAGRVAQPAAVAIAGTGLYWFLKRIAL